MPDNPSIDSERNRPRNNRSSKLQFSAALALAFASGGAALAHETLWTRRLVDVLGAGAATFSKVIGAFFLGLALGSALASRRKRFLRGAWTGVAAAELAVGLLAIPVLFSPLWSSALLAHKEFPLFIGEFLPILALLPPAAAMGFVLPCMLEALALETSRSSNFAVWVYGSNTLGGVVGILAILLMPLPAMGIIAAGFAICGVNLAVAVSAFAIATWQKGAREIDRPFRAPVSNTPRQIPLAWLSFASGFLILSFEVFLQHQLAQVTVNSQFSSGIVLALVLAGLFAGALLLPLLVNRFGERNGLKAVLLASGAICAAEPILFTLTQHGVAFIPNELPPAAYLFEVAKLGIVAVCPAVAAAGMVFPLLLRNVANTRPRGIGALLAWNGLGGWLGTEFSQDWLAPAFGLWTGVEIIAGMYLVAWALVDWIYSESEFGFPRRAVRLDARLLPLGAMVLCCWAGRGLPQATLLPKEHLAAVKVGREGVVAAVECAPGDWRILFNNNYTLGGSRAQFNQERQGLLPLLLHGSAKRVATLGVATGSTVAGASLYPGIKSVDAIELSPLVLEYARDFFGDYNRGIFENPSVHFIHADARIVMAREKAAYDVVIGDLFLPWRNGEGRLFTREHFQNVHRALKPGGLYCQWLPLFQLTGEQFAVISRTFLEVFPQAFLIRGDFYCELPIVGLVGGIGLGEVDWRKVAAGCAELHKAGSVKDPLLRHEQGVAMMILGPVPPLEPGPVNTLANAWLEWNAGHNIIGMKSPWFIEVPWLNFAHELQLHGNALMPENLRASQAAGEFFLRLDMLSKLGARERTECEREIPARLTAALMDDREAEWNQWPSRDKFSPASLNGH